MVATTPAISLTGEYKRDFYMQFREDDDALFVGAGTTRLRIKVQHFDQGTDRFLIGKAMSSLDQGQGLILVLVSLQ